MRKAVLYIAVSLDGYLADEQGGVSWLQGDGSDPQAAGSYEAFLDTIDTVVLGGKTYRQIVTELSPGVWVYPGKRSYVITRQPQRDTEEIVFTRCAPAQLVAELKAQPGKDIWICGGASLVQQLIAADLVDRFCITVMPVLLGKGIPLFAQSPNALCLKLISTQSYNGMVDLVYERRR